MSGFPYGFPLPMTGGTWPWNKRRRMYTEASICNLALIRIGSAALIDSLNEDTAEARACKVLYPHTRDNALSEFDWPFARRRSTLARLAGVERTNWGFAFTLPTDCLAVRSIITATRTPSITSQVPYTIETNDAGNGKILLCDSDNVEIFYTARLATVGLLPAYFVEALAWLLARELSMTLAVRPDLRQQALQSWEMSLARAESLALTEGHETEPESELVTVRG
jgi:hypothetical protein